MEYDADIYLLSDQFAQAYPNSTYPELMQKKGRPYSCLLIDTHSDYFICIPYRSSINHKNAFLFKGTKRSQQTKSGLDYSKMVLIQNGDYLDSVSKPVIDQDEYKETIKNLPKIVQEVIRYIDQYKNHANGTSPLHPREYSRKYQFASLPYFHDILGIDAGKANE